MVRLGGRSGAAGVLLAGLLLASPARAQSGPPPVPDGAISRLGQVELGYGYGRAALPRCFLRKGTVVAYPSWRDVVLYDLAARRTLRRIPGSAEVYRVDDDHLLTDADAKGPGDVLSSWDLRTDPAKLVYTVPKSSDRPVALSVEGARLAVAGPSAGEIQIYDSATGQPVSTYQGAASGPTALPFALSNTGKYLVVVDAAEGALVIWNVQTEKSKQVRLPPQAKRARWASFSADAKTLCLLDAGAEKPALLLVRATSGKLLRRIPQAPASLPTSGSVSPKGALVYAAGAAGWTIFDAAKGDVRAQGGAHGQPISVRAAFSADGALAAIGFPPASIRVWDMKAGTEVAPPVGLSAEPYALAFSPDGASLTSIWSDAATRISTVADGKVMRKSATRSGSHWRLDGPQTGIAWGEGGTAAGVHVGDPEKAGSLQALVTGSTHAVAPAGDGRRLAVSVGDVLTVLDYVAKKELWKAPGKVSAGDVALSGDGTLLAARVGTEVRVYEVPSGKIVHRAPLAKDVATVLCFCPNGKALAIAQDVWDTKTWKKLMSVPTKGEGALRAIAFSPDSALLAVGADSGRVGIFDANGKVLRALVGHVAPVTCLAWSPDGKRLATGSEDTTVLCWDLSGL